MAGKDKITVNHELVDIDTLHAKIEAGESLVIAADEEIIASLPSGNWIAGTIPYFMTEDGGKVDRKGIYVNTISGVSSDNAPRITMYNANTISRIAQEAPKHGFTILILPGMSAVHSAYAQNAPDYQNMFFSPIIGWISGVHLDDIETASAKVGFGPASGMLVDNQAVAMHVHLPEEQTANIKIINLFAQGDGHKITFPEKGFSTTTCQVDGVEWSFADYLKEHNIDTKLPLVANYSGVMVNVSIQDVGSDSVALYAPVFPGVEYRFAAPIDDYVEEFNKALPSGDAGNVAFCCNCILNFLYSELEGKKTGKMTGPITFGEIAYQLLNQTLVYLSLEQNT